MKTVPAKTTIEKKTEKKDFTVRFFCADDIRTDADGKGILTGFYSDNVLVVKAPKDVAPTKEVPFGLPSLAFMFTISGPRGRHRASIGLDHFGKPAQVQETEFELTPEKTSFNIIARLQPFLVSSFGKIKVKVSVDGHVFTEVLEIRRH